MGVCVTNLLSASRTLAPAAIAAGTLQGALTWLGGQPAWLLAFTAVTAAALVAWIALAVAITRHLLRAPSANDVRRMLMLQESQHAFNHAAWRLLQRDAEAIRFLHADQSLVAVEQDLVAAAHAVETVDAVAAAMPRWHEMRAKWYDLSRQALPELVMRDPNERELRAARDRLPHGRNLASADLKAMIFYLAQATQLANDRTRLHAARDASLTLPDVELPPVAAR
jgi:hypothetical protein